MGWSRDVPNQFFKPVQVPDQIDTKIRVRQFRIRNCALLEEVAYNITWTSVQ